MPTEVSKEIKRKLETSIQIISEAKKLADEIDETSNPEVVNHLVEVIEKQSQLLEVFVAEAQIGKPTESPALEDKLFKILGEYQKLKKEELRAKLAGLDISLAEEIKKRLEL